MKSKMFTFELDQQSLNETIETLKKAVELPRRKITQSVKKAMKIPLAKAKIILRSLPDDYKMTFEDGNTWTKDDIIKNLYLKLEKGNKDKKVYRLGIRDWKVDLYANFVEFGYHDKYHHYKSHEATHFMRNSLDDTALEVSKEIIEDIIKALEETGLLE